MHARFRVARGAQFMLELDLDMAGGEAVALVGPNGAGKTTALRALAGLLPVTDGHIELDGQLLATRRGMVPPERRAIGVVFQDYLLFPHLSALENVAFGLRARRIDRRTARARAREWLQRMGVGACARARPRQLSGGQAQRVALARALATEPRMLLLDEPLAALDASTRVTMRSELRRHLESYQGACLLVSHDPLDAMVLADRLLVLQGGRVVQQGTPAQVAERPRTSYVAQLVGLNLYRGTADGTTIHLAGGGCLATAEPGSGEVLVAFAPSSVSLHRQRPHGSPRNTWPVRVHSLEQHGTVTRVHASGEPDVLADITPAAVADLDVTAGALLWAELKATEVRSYPV